MKSLFSQFRLIHLGLVAIIAILPLSESFAQWGGTQGSGIPGMPGMRRGAGRNASNPDSANNPQYSHIASPTPGSHLLTYEQIETSLGQLEGALKLNSEQNKAWNNFASKVRLYASDIAKERAKLNSEINVNNDGIKYLDQVAEASKTRYNSLKEVADTARPLYKSLSAEQKTIFDNKVSSFIAATPKKLGNTQPSYNLPDLGGSPTQSSGPSALPGYMHQ